MATVSITPDTPQEQNELTPSWDTKAFRQNIALLLGGAPNESWDTKAWRLRVQELLAALVSGGAGGGGQGGNLLPGIIAPFSGTVADGRPINVITGLPDNDWGICDGSTYTSADGRSVATPDLRGRFILGVGADGTAGAYGAVAPATKGGSKVTATLMHTLIATEIPAHNHGLTFSGTTATSHTHVTAGAGVPCSPPSSSSGTLTGSTANNTGGAGHSHDIDPTPLYFSLCYVMFL